MNIKKILKDLLPYVIIIIVVILVRTFIATPVRVNGASMYPTLKGKEIMLLNQNVNRIFKIQNKMAKMKQELSEIRLEHEYFNKYEGKKIDDRIKIRNIKKLEFVFFTISIFLLKLF